MGPAVQPDPRTVDNVTGLMNAGPMVPTDRQALVNVFSSLANEMERDSRSLVALLSQYEPTWVAVGEVEKSVRCLRGYADELGYLEGRAPFGDVAVSLPFNNPLYSLILYTAGVALGGSRVHVRPSALTATAVDELVTSYSTFFNDLGIRLDSGSGRVFIETARSDPNIQSLIFTGSFKSMATIRVGFPHAKGLIYCGSGVNPFVVGAEPEIPLEQIADMIVASRYYNSGQDCLCTERLYLHDAIASDLIPIIADKAADLRIGDFGDPDADICPLAPPIAENAKAIIQDLRRSARCLLSGDVVGSLIPPHIFETDLKSEYLMAEKFSPVLTFATYSTDEDLAIVAASDHLFGATVIDSAAPTFFSEYPHLTTHETVIDVENDDAHAPFGGKRRSGFVSRGNVYREGPILYSIETTHARTDSPEKE